MTTNAQNGRVHFRLDGPSVRLDPRIHAVRHDLADISLAGILFAPHYARAQTMQCVAPGAVLRGKPGDEHTTTSQLLFGEAFHVLDITGNWAWGFCAHDGYVGYVAREALSPDILTATHQITSVTAPVFAEADIKSPVRGHLPFGAKITGEPGEDFISVADGFVHVRHCADLTPATDHVAEARKLLGQPYLWGGRGWGGIDCSGLVQVALGRCGRNVPRDSDLQRETIGTSLPADAPLRKGDFIFFPGHVGIMTDEEHLLHANAHWMATVEEPLAHVVARLQTGYAEPILSRRRLG